MEYVFRRISKNDSECPESNTTSRHGFKQAQNLFYPFNREME